MHEEVEECKGAMCEGEVGGHGSWRGGGILTPIPIKPIPIKPISAGPTLATEHITSVLWKGLTGGETGGGSGGEAEEKARK